MFSELRAKISKYSNEELAIEIAKCLKHDGVVNVLYMQDELVE